MPNSLTSRTARLPNEILEMILYEYIHLNRGDFPDCNSYPRNGIAAQCLQLENIACSSRRISKFCKSHTWKTILIRVPNTLTLGSMEFMKELADLNSGILLTVQKIKVRICIGEQNVSNGTILQHLQQVKNTLQKLMRSGIGQLQIEIEFPPVILNPPGANWDLMEDRCRSIIDLVHKFKNLKDLSIIISHGAFEHELLTKLIQNLPHLKKFECTIRALPDVEPETTFSSEFSELGYALASLTDLEDLTLLGPGYPDMPWLLMDWKSSIKSLSLGNLTRSTSRPLFQFIYKFRRTLKTLKIQESDISTQNLPDSFEKDFIALKSLTISGVHSNGIPYLNHLKFCPEVTYLRLDSIRAPPSFQHFVDTFKNAPKAGDNQVLWKKLERLVIGCIDVASAPTSLAHESIDLPALVIQVRPLTTDVFLAQLSLWTAEVIAVVANPQGEAPPAA
ncbi:hypothetical protein CROQUDRAFT_106929 [Cronartium quercuum f. sp. fusiforme G11]|uniref:F-box domain-containing protein n=1 Tax=Cronartium quercuum f. sp. fusiforme G11 TaxID=708437 RepID=A0A9P6NNL1_9BASI|nr:hypothetical protein CROQUDRAFT_106929 [Cronartium quercuum f. sp. fusiforme G11]